MPSKAQLEAALNEGVSGSWTKVGSLYMLDTRENFEALLGNLDDGVVLENNETLLDMGHELRFGIMGDESSVLVYRQVQRSVNTSGVVGGSAVGYVVTSNTYDKRSACSDDVLCRVVRS